MLDIIILSNSEKKDVIKSLISILYQTIEVKLNIYIVDYNKRVNYKDIVKNYSKITDIFELKCDKNVNVGNSKQYALDNSKGKYILFMNSGDEFASPYAIHLLLKKIIDDNADIVYGNYYENSNKGFTFVTDDEITLNSKIFSRKFLKNNKIKFNSSKINASYAFNKLIEMYNPKKSFMDVPIYVVKERNVLQFESGKYELDYFNYYVDDVNYIFEFMKKHNLNDKKIYGKLALQVLFFSYLYYIKNKKVPYKKCDLIKTYLKNKLPYKLENNVIIDCLNERSLSKLMIDADISFKEYISEME